MMSKIITFLCFIIISHSSFSEDKFIYFMAGQHASTESFLQAIQSFDPAWAEQIGSYMKIISLDTKYKKLNERYQLCVYTAVNHHDLKTLNIVSFFANIKTKCDPHLLELQQYIQKLIKK